ncbi:hypothetical protein D6C78_05800 [Aureobasidium pullulans]|uniref:Uncharacterized protein n=1 Tax=Aureobasidium pullulans TaxID=5580 RepID=A0A4T0BPA1_AURPU|nr:hypothetical protein D6C78_05800 [Aureobasidium pullulans]
MYCVLRFSWPYAIGEGSLQTGFAVLKKGKFDYWTCNGDGFLTCPINAKYYLVYVCGASTIKDDADCLDFGFSMSKESAPALISSPAIHGFG